MLHMCMQDCDGMCIDMNVSCCNENSVESNRFGSPEIDLSSKKNRAKRYRSVEQLTTISRYLLGSVL